MLDLRSLLHELRATDALILALAAAALLVTAPAGDDSAGVTRARALMGTLCTVRVEGAGTATEAAGAARRALDEIARLEPLLSSWSPASELQRLNARAAREAVPCSPELFEVTTRSLALARATGGAFDPSVEPLMLAWDVRGKGRVPTRAERDAALARTGWRLVACDSAAGAVRFARDGVGLDLGGIAKGYALDRAAAALAAGGPAPRALLNLGGEALALSSSAPWTVDLADPADRLRPVAAVRVANRAVSTSAQGERALRAGGRSIGHVVDPRTGVPAPTRASVTVIAADATTADALSTALLVMGRDAAARFADRHREVGVVWLEPAGRETRGWRWNQDADALPGARLRWMR